MHANVGLWATILVTTAIYVAVGFTLGCWCGGTASTSAGMLVYLALAGAVALIGQSIPVPGLQGVPTSVEFQVLRLLQETPTALVSVYSSLTAWVLFWFLVARLSYRRLSLR